jgi:hypothetical protein
MCGPTFQSALIDTPSEKVTLEWMAPRVKQRPIAPFSRAKLAAVLTATLSILLAAILFPPRPSVTVSLHRSQSLVLSVDPFPVTFLTIPKPQRLSDQIEMSKLVLTVWLSYPDSRVILFSSASEFDPLNRVLPVITARFGSDRLTFVESLKTGYQGRPLVREWFQKGTDFVKTGFLCFTNADMIVPEDWMDAARRIFATFKETELNRTMIFGTRTDVWQSSRIFNIQQDSANFMTEVDRYLRANVRGDNPYGMDLVMMHSSFSGLRWGELPDFVIGMCVWDNFFMGWAIRRCNTVSMDFQVRLFHVDHGANACNDENYEIFRDLSRQSPYFAGWSEHRSARWLLRLGEEVLTRDDDKIRLVK